MLKINQLNNSKVFYKEKGKTVLTDKKVSKKSHYFEKQREISSINNEFTLTPNHNQVIWQKQYQRLIQIAYYQAGKTVVQTLLPQHPPVSLITLNHLGITASTSADIYISSDSTSNTQCCSSLESRLIGLYGGKATSQLFEYEYKRMSFFYNSKENPFAGADTILPHVPASQAISDSIPKGWLSTPYHLRLLSPSGITCTTCTTEGGNGANGVATIKDGMHMWYEATSLMIKSTCGMGSNTGKILSNTSRKTVYGNGSNSEKRVRMMQQLDKRTLLGYFQKRSLALWKKRTHMVACSPQYFSSMGKGSKTNFLQNKKTTNFPNLVNESQNLIRKLKNKRDLYNFSTTLVRVLSADTKTSFEKDTPSRLTSLGEHVITPILRNPRTLCTTKEEQVPQKLQKTNTECSRSFAGAGNNFFQSNIGTIEIQTATRLANLLVNTWNFYSFNPKLVGEIEDASYAKLFEQKQGNKVFPKSSYSSKRISIENVKRKESSNVETLNLVNSFQFSNVQRDRFSLGWFRLYLPDIEATTFLKNAANYFFNLGLQTVVRPSISKLNPKLYSSACDFKFACVDQFSKELKRSNIFSLNNTKRPALLDFNITKRNRNNSSQVIPILPFNSNYLNNSKVKTASFTWQKTKGKITEYSQNVFSCLFEGKTTNNLRIGLGLLRNMAKRRNQTYYGSVKGLMNKKNIPHRIGLIGDKVDKINIKYEQLAYLDVSSFLSLEKQIILKGSTNDTTFDHNLKTSFQYYYSTLQPKTNKSVRIKGCSHIPYMLLSPSGITCTTCTTEGGNGAKVLRYAHVQQFSNPQAYLLLVLPSVCVPSLPSSCFAPVRSKMVSFGDIRSSLSDASTGYTRRGKKQEDGISTRGLRSISTAKGNKQKKSGMSPNDVNVNKANKAFNVEKELISRALINNSFTKAFLLINQNRQLLDYFVDYLIRFQILRQHQILYLFSAILLNCKKSK